MLYPVILCGGSGTRLWPLSRDMYPKQFVVSVTVARCSGIQSAGRHHCLNQENRWLSVMKTTAST